jgi:hypothetical protein
MACCLERLSLYIDHTKHNNTVCEKNLELFLLLNEVVPRGTNNYASKDCNFFSNAQL